MGKFQPEHNWTRSTIGEIGHCRDYGPMHSTQLRKFAFEFANIYIDLSK